MSDDADPPALGVGEPWGRYAIPDWLRGPVTIPTRAPYDVVGGHNCRALETGDSTLPASLGLEA